jgi:hypothetical protein
MGSLARGGTLTLSVTLALACGSISSIDAPNAHATDAGVPFDADAVPDDAPRDANVDPPPLECTDPTAGPVIGPAAADEVTWTPDGKGKSTSPTGLAIAPGSGATPTQLGLTAGASPPRTPLRGLSGSYLLTQYGADVIDVAIPLDRAYSGCPAAIYASSGYAQSGPWRRVTEPSTGGVARGRFRPPFPGGLLVAGLCASECDGICTDLATDDANCGTCGNACAAPATCAAGACAGQVVAALPGTVDASEISQMVADDANVYYVNRFPATHCQLGKVALSTGASTDIGPRQGCTRDLRLASGWLYLFNGGGFERASITTGTVQDIPAAALQPPFAVDGTSLYFIGGGGLSRVPVDATDGGAATVVASAHSSILSVDADGQRIVWVDGSSLFRLDALSATPVELTSSLAISPSASGTALIQGDGVLVALGVALDRVPLVGGAPTRVASSGALGDIAVAGDRFAWRDVSDGSAWAIAPGARSRLASGGVTAVAATSSYVYLASGGNGPKIRRVPWPRP